MAALLEKHKWSRGIIFLILLPGIFTYTSLINWLKANECWSVLKQPHNQNVSAGSQDILKCRHRGILLPPENYPSIVRLTQTLVTHHGAIKASDDMETVWLFSRPNTAAETLKSGSASEEVNKYGFRSNKNKRRPQQNTPLIPFATYLLGAINIGLYWAYWNYRVDPGRIVHNSEILHDYGRAFTSTFGHFEIWHVGINMMTLFSLGSMLELQIYGPIPFFMYTMSFVPLTAIVVVALQRFTGPSSMVGFSGILFAWSVVATLSSSQSCPIMFLPDFCFSTYQFLGVPVSLGPLVQLVFLQMVLPRVSFVGHLSGIIVGFFWHWNLLPPLEWFQPSILLPVLWIIGKLVLPRFPSWDVTNTAASRGGVSGGYTVGGSSGSEAGVVPLIWIRNALVFHCCLVTYCAGVMSSTTISQVLLLLILSMTANARKNSNSDTNTPYTDWAMMGRGFVIFVCCTIMTDAMTIMGWLSLDRNISILFTFCIILRWALLYSSLCMMCHMLHVANQTLPGSIWFHSASWLIVDSCRPLGAWLIAYLSTLSDGMGSRDSRYSRLGQKSAESPPESPKKSVEPAQVSNIV